MGKIVGALALVFAIELAISLFVSCVPGGSVSCEEKTSLFTFLLNPQDWSLAGLVNMLQSDIFLIGGATAIVIGSMFFKYDFIVYAGVAGVFFGFGQTLYQWWQQTNSQAVFGDASGIVATILLSGFVLFFIVTILEFARGKD